MPVIAVMWWGAGQGSGEGLHPLPRKKKLYKGSVVTVSASYSSEVVGCGGEGCAPSPEKNFFI